MELAIKLAILALVLEGAALVLVVAALLIALRLTGRRSGW